jgi:HAD superfamily hydrolase (TIGR01509 family)
VHAIGDSRCSVDAVIFDLFGVIISFDDEIVSQRIAQHCTDPSNAFVALTDIVSQSDLIRGRITLDQMHRKLVATYGLTLDLRDFEAAWLTPYTAPMPGMADFIRTLAASYRLILLSNVDEHYWKVVRKAHPELNYFSAHLLSWDLKIAKPDREIFLRAVDAARTSASRCLFVDDKEENVEAARDIGLLAHRFRGATDLREVFEREGIRCA